MFEKLMENIPIYIRVGGLLEFGRAHKTTYEFDYSEQFSIKNDLDLRPNELEIGRSIWSTILLNFRRHVWCNFVGTMLVKVAQPRRCNI